MLTDSFPCMKTQRCELLEFSDSDCTDLYLLLQDQQVQHYLPGLLPFCKSVDTALQMIKIFGMNYYDGNAILWKINHNGQLIGFIGIADISDTPYLFYAVSPTHRCRGYMTECVMVLKEYLTKQGYNRPTIDTDITNIASLKIKAYWDDYADNNLTK